MVITNLVKRLSDDDKWVRYKVMLAISGMLEKNPEAVPLRTLFGLLADSDEKVREATVKAIGKIGHKDFPSVHAKLTAFLADPATNVRDACVGAYFDMSGKVGITVLLPKLLMLLSDEVDLETQRSVSQILRRVAKYEKEEIRTRIIKLLRIRCEMSQDATICRVLSEFEQF
jgi:HEAT repeat protein